MWRLAIPAAIAAFGVALLVWGIVNERRMQRHRQPGVSYAQVTWRRDGGWRRADLFTETGLAYQRRASTYGFSGAGLVIVALVLLAVLA
jgi:hypothetical protein